MNECELCGTPEDIVEHHTSYEPEETVMVCRSCHGRVHTDPDHPLHPGENRKGTVEVPVDHLTKGQIKEASDPDETLSETMKRLLATECPSEIGCTFEAKIDNKGRVVIPKEEREILGIDGREVVAEVEVAV